MFRKLIFICTFMCIVLSIKAQLNVQLIQGLPLGDNNHATYVGTNLEYRIDVACSDSIASVKSFTAGGDNLKFTLEKGKLIVENYIYVADKPIKDNAIEFSLLYEVEDSVGKIEKHLEPITFLATVYTEPVDNGKINRLTEDMAAISSGKFEFELEDIDMTTGDPDGWSYTWSATDGSSKLGDKVDWTFTNTGSSAKTYTVTMVATNRINGSTDSKYFRSFTKKMDIVVYPALSISMKADSRKNVIVDDNITFNALLQGGQSAKWGDAHVVVDGKEVEYTIKDDVVSFSYIFDKSSSSYNISIDVNNHPNGMKDGQDVASKEWTVYVWDKPDTKGPEITSYELRGGYDQSVVLGCEILGGCQTIGSSENGWKYEWYKGNKKISSSSNYTINPDVKQNEHEPYIVKVSNYVDGQVIYSQTYQWDVVIWASPSSPVIEGLDAFYKESALLSVSPQGGYEGNNELGGWKYAWICNGETVNTTTDKNFETKVFPVGDGDDYKNEEYKLVATNYWKDGSLWKEFVVNVPITVHPTPAIDYADFPTDIYYNTPVSFSFTEIGGIKGMWFHRATYEAINNEELGTENVCSFVQTGSKLSSTLIARYARNNGDKMRTLTIHITSTNGIGSNRKIIEHDLRVNVWPEVKFGETESLAVSKMRSGDILTIRGVKPQSGGYAPDGNTQTKFTYRYENQSLLDNTDAMSCDYRTIDDNSNTKNIRKQKVTCDVYALGPKGEVWAQKSYTQDVSLYSHPEIPDEIILKGNGTSSTYIFIMEDNDDILDSRAYNYTLVSANNDKVHYYGDKRYGVCPSLSINDLKGATYWEYDDGSTVYSDFIDSDGKVTLCTWSDFANRGPVTRASEADAIEAISNASLGDSVYDLQGRKVNTLIKGKLYVKNGKKYLVK